jgi:two-component system CheB/CheR fusion protein
MIAALYGGLGPALLATVLASIDTGFTFMLPYETVIISADDLLRLAVFLMVALLTSSLQTRRRAAEESLRRAHDQLEQRVVERTARLLRSEEQFRVLVNGVTDQAFFQVDAEGRISVWNAGAERLLGYASREIIGSHYTRLLPDRVQGSVPTSLSTGGHAAARFEDQGWVVRKDGSRFWANFWLARMQESPPNDAQYVMSIRDVSERLNLEREILAVGEQERQRIGHDLHDGLGQELTGASMMLTALAERIGQPGAVQAADVEEVARLVRECIEQSRELAKGLCPVDLEDEGLVAALRMLAERVSRLPGVVCRVDAGTDVRADPVTALNLFRIAQEAINNAIRHGSATHIDVSLTESGSAVSLVIADDGTGIATEPAKATGLGLRIMNYRAKMLRGSLSVHRGDTCGTVVTCSFNRTGGVDSSEQA